MHGFCIPPGILARRWAVCKAPAPQQIAFASAHVQSTGIMPFTHAQYTHAEHGIMPLQGMRNSLEPVFCAVLSAVSCQQHRTYAHCDLCASLQVAVGVVLAITALAFLALLDLAIFHAILCWRGMTTLEFIFANREAGPQTPGDYALAVLFAQRCSPPAAGAKGASADHAEQDMEDPEVATATVQLESTLAGAPTQVSQQQEQRRAQAGTEVAASGGDSQQSEAAALPPGPSAQRQRQCFSCFAPSPRRQAQVVPVSGASFALLDRLLQRSRPAAQTRGEPRSAAQHV